MFKVLFVCTGNICRSPTAEGVLRHYIKKNGLENKIFVDSAGTEGFHVGQSPDSRSIEVAAKRGISLAGQKARKVKQEDFSEFDLILALDKSHYNCLKKNDINGNVKLFLEYAGETEETEVPDPYYGSNKDFEHVLDLVESGVEGLLKKLY